MTTLLLAAGDNPLGHVLDRDSALSIEGTRLTLSMISLVVGAVTRGYLLMREACDGQPSESVWPFEVPLDASDRAGSPSAGA
jgi:hypothetical protein